MKMSINWHKECQKNTKSSLERKKEELSRLIAQVDDAEQKYNLYSAQISLAEKEGKDGFDNDKYAIKRIVL